MGSKKKLKPAAEKVTSNNVCGHSLTNSKPPLINQSMVPLNSQKETGQMDMNLQRAIRAEKRLLELHYQQLVTQIQAEISKKEEDATQRLALYGTNDSSRKIEVRNEFTEYISKKEKEKTDLLEFYNLCKKALDHGISYDDLEHLGYPDNRYSITQHIQAKLVAQKPPPSKSTNQPVVENKDSSKKLDWVVESEKENVKPHPKVPDLRDIQFDNFTIGGNDFAASIDELTLDESTSDILASIPSVSATSKNTKHTQLTQPVSLQSAPVAKKKEDADVKSKQPKSKQSPRELEPVVHQAHSGLIQSSAVHTTVSEEKGKIPNWSQEPFNSIVGNFTETYHCERKLAVGLLSEQFRSFGSDELSCDWADIFIEAGRKLKLIKESKAKPPTEQGTAWSTVGATEVVKSKPVAVVKAPPPKVTTAPKSEKPVTKQPAAVSKSQESVVKPLTNVSFYKAIYCRNMKENGKCPYGSDCFFAHHNTELRPHPTTVRKAHPDSNIQHRYSNPSLREAEANRKAFVGALAHHTTKQSFDQYFKKYGTIVDSVVMFKDGKPRGFGFVTYSKPQELKQMLESVPHRLDGKTVDAKIVTVMDDDSQNRYAGPGKNFMVGIDKDKSLKDEDKRGQVTSAKQKARQEPSGAAGTKRTTDQHGEQHVSDQECIFCMEPLIDFKRLDCGHDRFHLECISRWVNEQNASCPICRTPAKLPDLFKAPAGMKPEEFPALPM